MKPKVGQADPAQPHHAQIRPEKRGREIPTRSRYSDQEIELGLSAVALYSGNTRRAAESLAAAGQPIPRETLRGWLNLHPIEYERIRREITPRLKERMASVISSWPTRAWS